MEMEMRMRETGIWCGISRSWGGKREGRLLNSRRCSTLFIRENPKLVSLIFVWFIRQLVYYNI